MTNTETTPATPEGDAVSRALPNAYYECAGCTQQGSESNCRPAEEIRLAPDETWLCEYCYDDAAYECGEDANWPVWADLPKLSAALTAQPVAQEPVADTVGDVVRGVWGRCEALEDEAYLKLEGDLTEHELGFWRGQKMTAKSIRRSTEMPATPAPVEAGARWNKTVDGLPQKPGKRDYEQIECLIMLPNGDLEISVWNCEHLVWDDAEGDDFRYDPGYPTHWLALAPFRAALRAAQSAPVGGEVKG